jgi:gliding motility-associated-like protein
MNKSIFPLLLGWFLFPLILSAQPIFNISNETGPNGSTVEVDFSVDSFEKIISMQYSINWDSTVLQFNSISNVTSEIPGFSPSAIFSTPPVQDKGVVTLSWFEPNAGSSPVTLPDQTMIYTIVFDVIGDPCDQTKVEITGTPLAIEVAEEGSIPVTISQNGGDFMVPGTGCTQNDISITGSMESGSTGTEVCVKYTAVGFRNLGSMLFGLKFNENIIEYKSTQNYGLPGLAGGNFGTTNAENGEINFLWFDQNGTGVDITDGTILFELCFDVVGGGGQMSTIDFTDTPNSEIEIADIDGNILNVVLTPGKVTAEGGNIEGFALFSSDECAGTNANVCVEITSQEFTDIISFQGSVNWDPAVLEYVGSENYGIPDFSEGNIGTPDDPGNDPGEATFAWFDNNVSGVNVADGTVLFSLCYKVLGASGTSSQIRFTSTPLTLEVADVDGNVLAVTKVEGTVTVDPDCQPCGFSVDDTMNPCNGETNGTINISVFGCPAPITYLWNDGVTTEDRSGLAAGTYTVTITTGDNTILVPGDIVLSENPAIMSTAVVTNPTPGNTDGAIDLTVSGGTAPYTFLWSANANSATTEDVSGLGEGAYSVTITDDNGCTFEAGPFDLGLGISCGVTDIVCFGEANGAIDLTATFGTGPYTFLWNDNTTSEDRTNLIAGTYCVTVTDANSATMEKCVDISGPDEAIFVSPTIVNDPNDTGVGSIALMVTGGEGPYSFDWDNGATTQNISNLFAGVYCVAATDNRGCVFEECYTVIGSEMTVSLSTIEYNGFNVSCNGVCDGEIISTVTNGIGALTYSWSDGQSASDLSELCAGTYILTVTDGSGQTATASIDLSSPTLIEISTQTTEPSAAGMADGRIEIQATGGVGPYTYLWNDAGNSTTPVLNNLSSGAYMIVVTDQNNCEAVEQISLFGPEGCYKAIKVITPNGDEVNENLIISCVSNERNVLHIFNRWGSKIYEQSDYDNSWNGVDEDGDPVVDGGYHWVLEVFLSNNDTRVYKGTVSVIRSLK